MFCLAMACKALPSLGLDADVIEWFRGPGPGYQFRINALLREYMEGSQSDGQHRLSQPLHGRDRASISAPLAAKM